MNLTTERKAPTLVDMSARVLAENSEAIKSLNLVPDHLKKKISSFARNCVDLVEKDLINVLCDCDRSNLLVSPISICSYKFSFL